MTNVNEGDAGYYYCSTSLNSFIQEFLLIVTGIVPYFAQNPVSYKQYPTLPNAYLNFDINISFKPHREDGLIFFNGKNNIATADFISLGLKKQIPEFRFNLGSGRFILKSFFTEMLCSWRAARHLIMS